VLVECFLDAAGTLKELGGLHEDWDVRIAWLQSVMGELWESRGLYPGLPACLDFLGFRDAIAYFRARSLRGEEQAARDAIFGFLEGESASVPGLPLDQRAANKIGRSWVLRDEDEIRCQVYNFRSEPVPVQRGERIAQGIVVPILRVEWDEVPSMGVPSRGGFGSTGY